MDLLADESCDFAVVRALREAGFNVTAVSEFSPGAEDNIVIDLAMRERRLVITEDKDFGQLIYAGGRATVGVLFLRYPAGARALMAESVVEVIKKHGDRLMGRFVVLQPGRVRIGGRQGKSS